MIAAALTSLLLLAPRPQDPSPSPTVEAYVREAQAALDAGQPQDALLAIDRALERTEHHARALRLRARIAEALDDMDQAVHGWHRFIDLVETLDKNPLPRLEWKEIGEHLLALDPEAKTWSKLKRRYARGLLDVAKAYEKKRDWLGALEAFQQLLQVEPGNRQGEIGTARVRRLGGSEVAVEDVFAGGDPLAGYSAEVIAALDAAHSEWENAHTKETKNYRYRTDAGLLVLETSAIAMEQMNRFYRRFFRFKEGGGKTPRIEIRVFKNRDEYLTLGRNPAPWSGGHFIGSAVETYVGGVDGLESVRGMYRTLFHEAAHQFVSLTVPLVPGWLNEAYASFFEGCVILSNGTVRWNLAPPGRLFPLAQRMEKGWMASPDEAAPGQDGNFPSPDRAPSFRMVVAGNYRWGPPWYAPTWGVVYFLYNARTDDGQRIYREALHAYYGSFRRGRPADPVAHFEEMVLAGAPLSPVETIDGLDAIWKDWILRLRDIENGKLDVGNELVTFARAAAERDETRQALELYLEALDNRPDDPDLLWAIAPLHEQLKEKPRAAARYRQLKRVLELSGRTDDPRYEKTVRKVRRLDPLFNRHRLLKELLAADGLTLARGYAERGLPHMALEIARRMSGKFSLPAALDLYRQLATETGVSLARWKVAYNEQDLAGWSGDQAVWQAYGRRLRTQLEANEGALPSAGSMLTNQLMCDVPFDGDVSLEAQMRVSADREGNAIGKLVGLCFGRKGDQDFHGVFLHPKGFMDVVSNRGGTWEILDHRSATVGTTWHTLRIDVTGKTVDIYLDGFYVRSLEFKNERTVRGGFGLLCGEGRCEFREVRVLARDPFDPAARIERELAMQRVMEDPGKRQPGTFTGLVPPELTVGKWARGEATSLAALKGKVVVLVFWSPRQDRVIPCAAWLKSLRDEHGDDGVAWIIVGDVETTADGIDRYLESHPLPGWRIALDPSRRTYDDYFVKAGHHGMPRVLLIDRQGRVAFEGDPGLKSGLGWQVGDPPTYVDEPLSKLLGR